jgi:hypothetical protein
VQERKLTEWKVEGPVEETVSAAARKAEETAEVALLRNFEFRLPLAWLLALPGQGAGNAGSGDGKAGASPVAASSKLRLRFSLWQNRLPMDALPVEGWIELELLSEWDFDAGL